MAELNVLERVIQELNPRLRDAYEVEFRILTAGNAVVPGIGTDPQAIINAQISDQYDVYLGMLGARFGAPTPRAGSGTEEEFRLACDHWVKAPDSVKILFYFKGTPDVPVQDLDVQQLARVQEFKASIKKQIFYADFKATDDFLPLVREHLWQLVASQWDGDKWKSAKMPTELAAALNVGEGGTDQATVSIGFELAKIDGPIAELARDADDQEKDKDMELLDALVEAQDSIQAGLAALDRIAASTREQNDKFVQHGRIINFVAAKGDAKAKDLKMAVDAAADDIASYAQALRREVPGFTSAFTSGLNAFDLAMNSWIREKPPAEQIVGVRQMLEQVIPVLRSARDPVISFRDAMAKMPTLTSRLKKATRATRIQLDDLIAGLAIISDRAVSISARLSGSEDSGN
ncbi:MAG: hypothetical protein DMG89_02730 [Acidobacteria bacterium]|nr:MAG: hypothetical protein DMG89_02730 [Acidobacteriota bacterium]